MDEPILFLRSSTIQKLVLQCANYITDLSKRDDIVLCPMMQSSYRLIADLSNHTPTLPIDFAGVIKRDYNSEAEDLYVYKAPNPAIYRDKTVIVLDVVAYTGGSLKFVKTLINQLGAKRVYTAALLKSQFCTYKLDWTGYIFSDETLFGYGIDHNGTGRMLNDIFYV